MGVRGNAHNKNPLLPPRTSSLSLKPRLPPLCVSYQTLEMELPDTAASIRLSSLEMSDCMSELGALGSDLTGGIQSAARMVSATEAGVRQGAQAIGGAVVPALAQRETRVRGVCIWTRPTSGLGRWHYLHASFTRAAEAFTLLMHHCVCPRCACGACVGAPTAAVCLQMCWRQLYGCVQS